MKKIIIFLSIAILPTLLVFLVAFIAGLSDKSAMGLALINLFITPISLLTALVYGIISLLVKFKKRGSLIKNDSIENNIGEIKKIILKQELTILKKAIALTVTIGTMIFITYIFFQFIDVDTGNEYMPLLYLIVLMFGSALISHIINTLVLGKKGNNFIIFNENNIILSADLVNEKNDLNIDKKDIKEVVKEYVIMMPALTKIDKGIIIKLNNGRNISLVGSVFGKINEVMEGFGKLGKEINIKEVEGVKNVDQENKKIKINNKLGGVPWIILIIVIMFGFLFFEEKSTNDGYNNILNGTTKSIDTSKYWSSYELIRNKAYYKYLNGSPDELKEALTIFTFLSTMKNYSMYYNDINGYFEGPSYILYKLYSEGNGIEKDLGKSIEYLDKSMENNNPYAFYDKGLISKGGGDLENANKYFNKSLDILIKNDDWGNENQYYKGYYYELLSSIKGEISE